MPTHRMYCTADEAKGNAMALALAELRPGKPSRGWKPNHWEKREIQTARFEKDGPWDVLVVAYTTQNDKEDEC